MSGAQPPEPALFLKRSRRVQKRRRVVTPFSGPDNVDEPNVTLGTENVGTVFSSNASISAAPSSSGGLPTIQDHSRSRPYSLRVKPRVQTKLKQAPVVPGYEPESDPSNEKQASYTEEQLKQLKQKLRITPHSRPSPTVPSDGPPLRVSKNSSAYQQHRNQTASSSSNKVEHGVPSNEKSRFSLSQPSRPTTAKQIPGTAGAAPFSAEWKARIYDEDDIEVEHVSNFSRTETGASDSESADAEWEAQIMRRAAQKTTDQDQYLLRREMNIIRDVEMEGTRTGAFKRLKVDIGKRIDELAAQQAYVEQKIDRLAQVVRQDTDIKGNANASVEDIRRKVELYEDLVQRISTASRKVAASKEVFERWESFIEDQMTKRIRQITVWLNGGTDEFGRERKVRILDIGEIRDDFQEWGGRLVEQEQKEVIELREELSFEKITRLAKDWRESFPEEYDSAFADAALGKLLGKLALLENDIGFVLNLDQREEMIKTAIMAFGVERFATWIKARWEPRLFGSCEFVGDLMEAINTAPEDAIKLVRAALQARLELEIEALKALGEKGITQVLRGLLVVSKKGQFDPGFVKVIQACEDISGLEGFEEEFEWLTECSFIRDDARKICQWRDKLRRPEHKSNGLS
ncbi:hypothetical protein FGB62_3g222 [Gracilaria domingensis]|nr:hypothetical protein FGB62_3g222 [Gracilaria domingensis]